jgi:hypothetical protein
MWKVRVLVITILALVALAIIATDAGSRERETRTAFDNRFHEPVTLAINPMFRRGVVCGVYRLNGKAGGRFAYVSHYSGEDRRFDGLHVRNDRDFDAVSRSVCR